jgi:hypothetical protein
MLQLIVLVMRGERSKEIEILVLRHQVKQIRALPPRARCYGQ